jgi:hypothetical protein
MKMLAMLGAALVVVAAPANAAVTVSNYELNFTDGAGFLTPDVRTAPGEYQDVYTFFLGATSTISSSLSTQSLFDQFGNVVSDMDFGNSIDGIYLDGAIDQSFVTPLPNSEGLEVYTLASTLLSPGYHTLTVNYTVNTASSGVGATYAGPVFASVASVPEPATWAMFVGAFGAVGASLRSRKRQQPAFNVA